ncbi:lipopolysaccharide biosynthesis protein, partial [Lacticaseibacillus paracasei]
MLPRMANVFAKKDMKKLHSFLYASFDFVSFISVPSGFGLAAISKKFATLFMGPEFAITGDLIFVMSLIILPVAWTNVLGNQYLLPTNQTKKYTFAISMGALVNIVLNVLLIENFGVMGAVVA